MAQVQVNRARAPPPDGIPAEFYRIFADLVAPELTEVLKEASVEGKLPLGGQLRPVL